MVVGWSSEVSEVRATEEAMAVCTNVLAPPTTSAAATEATAEAAEEASTVGCTPEAERRWEGSSRPIPCVPPSGRTPLGLWAARNTALWSHSRRKILSKSWENVTSPKEL
jgi:hypothetical protein